MSENKEEKVESEIQQVADCSQKAETDVNAETTVESKKTNGSKKMMAKKKKPIEGNPVRGLPKSGRPWKTPKKKFSTIKKSTQRSTFEQKMELRNEIRHIKELSREIKAQRKEAAVQKNQRRIENAERRLANERRSEVVQVIKNTSKLKRMKKKQMRMIEKRDISQVKVV